MKLSICTYRSKHVMNNWWPSLSLTCHEASVVQNSLYSACTLVTPSILYVIHTYIDDNMMYVRICNTIRMYCVQHTLGKMTWSFLVSINDKLLLPGDWMFAGVLKTTTVSTCGRLGITWKHVSCTHVNAHMHTHAYVHTHTHTHTHTLTEV